MRCVKINQQTIYYALYLGKTAETDTSGNYTGDYVISYADPVAMKANVSPARKWTSVEPYGLESDYTHVMMTDNMSCPITETTLVWIGKPITENANFRVVKVAKSLNHITYDLEEIMNP